MSYCTLGVGCDEYGVCYASVHGKPEECGISRQEHQWIGWGWDETICKHCRVNLYVPFQVRSKYCDEYEAEKLKLKEDAQNKAWKNEEDHY